jgi:hypothetical protein
MLTIQHKMDKTGGLLVADDAGNIIWRTSPQSNR